MQDDLQARQGETVPVMRISLRADTPADTQRAIADGVHRAMVDALGLPEADRFQIIERLPAEALIADPGYLGVTRRNVVFVNITLVPRSPQKKAALFAEIAKRLAAAGGRREDLFAPLPVTGRAEGAAGNGEQQLLAEPLLRGHAWTPPSPGQG